MCVRVCVCVCVCVCEREREREREPKTLGERAKDLDRKTALTCACERSRFNVNPLFIGCSPHYSFSMPLPRRVCRERQLS